MNNSKSDYIFVIIIFYTLLAFFLTSWGGGFEESEISVLGVNIKIGIVGAIYNMPVAVTIVLSIISLFSAWLILSSILPSSS